MVVESGLDLKEKVPSAPTPGFYLEKVDFGAVQTCVNIVLADGSRTKKGQAAK